MVDQGNLPQRLFGAHVTQRAHQIAASRQGRVGLAASKSKIGHPELVVAVQHQIGRLDVAMDDAVFVGCVQGRCRLDSQSNDRPKILAATHRPRGQQRMRGRRRPKSPLRCGGEGILPVSNSPTLRPAPRACPGRLPLARCRWFGTGSPGESISPVTRSGLDPTAARRSTASHSSGLPARHRRRRPKRYWDG